MSKTIHTCYYIFLSNLFMTSISDRIERNKSAGLIAIHYFHYTSFFSVFLANQAANQAANQESRSD
ncbi:MAG TPA: hypothetical protein VF084_07920 [Nitrososphaeraceae archaeon]